MNDNDFVTLFEGERASQNRWALQVSADARKKIPPAIIERLQWNNQNWHLIKVDDAVGKQPTHKLFFGDVECGCLWPKKQRGGLTAADVAGKAVGRFSMGRDRPPGGTPVDFLVDAAYEPYSPGGQPSTGCVIGMYPNKFQDGQIKMWSVLTNIMIAAEQDVLLSKDPSIAPIPPAPQPPAAPQPPGVQQPGQAPQQPKPPQYPPPQQQTAIPEQHARPLSQAPFQGAQGDVYPAGADAVEVPFNDDVPF